MKTPFIHRDQLIKAIEERSWQDHPDNKFVKRLKVWDTPYPTWVYAFIDVNDNFRGPFLTTQECLFEFMQYMQNIDGIAKQ